MLKRLERLRQVWQARRKICTREIKKAREIELETGETERSPFIKSFHLFGHCPNRGRISKAIGTAQIVGAFL